MAEEEIKTGDEVTPSTDEETQTSKEVELPGGVKVTMSMEDFTKYKAKQDERSTEYKATVTELEEIRQKKAEAEQRAKLREQEKKEAELAEAGKIEELKAAIKKTETSPLLEQISELKGQVSAYETEVTKGKVRDAALSVENVNPKALDDIVTLSLPQITEGKSIEDTVKDVINSRDYLQLVKSPVGTPRGSKPTIGGNDKKSANSLFASAIENGALSKKVD